MLKKKFAGMAVERRRFNSSVWSVKNRMKKGEIEKEIKARAQSLRGLLRKEQKDA